MAYGKAIELFLVNGTAESLITAELSNWNGKAIKLPRTEVSSCERDDIKGVGASIILVYSEERVYFGEYNAKEGIWKASDEYRVIDYVIEHYDKDAKFLNAISGSPLNMFYSSEELYKQFPELADREEMPVGKCYYFKDKDGDLFAAIDLKEFGVRKTGIRLFRDKASGMEEIKK